MTILLAPNFTKQTAAGVTRDILIALHQHGARVIMPLEARAHMPESGVPFLPLEDALAACDVIVTVGGDGTILHMAHACAGCNKPLLGVNLGRMGFLATVEAYELEKLARLVRGEYTLDKRSILAVEVSGCNALKQLAFNDVVISKSGISQTIDVAVYCDDTLVSHYQGDGVIIATPTGSTAYSLSAGGPILDARIAGLVVTPICAHSMHSPSMVFSAQRKIRVTLSSPTQAGAYLSCDGCKEQPISCRDIIGVSLSDQYVSLICFNEADQFEAIDKKLKGR